MRSILTFLVLIPYLGFTQWTISGSSIFNTNTGNVGIGITSPSVLLHLYKSSGDNLMRIESGGAFYSYLSLKNSVAEWQILNNNDGSFGVTNPNIERFHISSNGNVGIGTTSPGHKLHVAGTIKAGSYTFITEPNNGLASVFANNLYAGASNNTLVRQQNSDPGNYISLNYDRGIIFGTGVTSTAGAEVSDNINERMRIDLSGNVGIGTTSPRSKFEAVGVGKFSASESGSSIFIDGSALPESNNWSNVRLTAGGDGGGAYLKTSLDNWGGYFSWVHGSATGDVEIMRIGDNGVAIGTIDTKGYKLAVNGDAIFTKVKVKQFGSWPDYVFETSYKLPSLNEVEAFIQQHKHLPGVPSAKEVEKEGLDVGENQAVLLKKIEELTLYVIELKKENDEIRKRLEKSGK